MEILRIPTTYQTQVQWLSEKDISYVFKTLFSLSKGDQLEVENSARGGLVLSIWREASQMEKRATSKKGKQVTQTFAPKVLPLGAKKQHPNKVNESKVNTKQEREYLKGFDSVLIDSWNEWIQNKKERKESYTSVGEKKAFTKLFNLSYGVSSWAVLIIDKSITEQWKGFFQLKDTPPLNEEERELAKKNIAIQMKKWTRDKKLEILEKGNSLEKYMLKRKEPQLFC